MIFGTSFPERRKVLFDILPNAESDQGKALPVAAESRGFYEEKKRRIIL